MHLTWEIIIFSGMVCSVNALRQLEVLSDEDIYIMGGTIKQSPEKFGRVRRLNISLYVY